MYGPRPAAIPESVLHNGTGTWVRTIAKGRRVFTSMNILYDICYSKKERQSSKRPNDEPVESGYPPRRRNGKDCVVLDVKSVVW